MTVLMWFLALWVVISLLILLICTIGGPPPPPPPSGDGLSGPDREWLSRVPPGGPFLSSPERDAERERRRTRARLDGRGDPNDIAPWDAL